ncbi:Serum paraoxonase/arylesterase 1 [Mactra antiquata]
MWWINTALLVAGMTVFLDYRDWLDWNKHFFYKVAPGPCKYVSEDEGSEDLTHVGNGLVIMSSGLYLGKGGGKLKSLNLNTSEVVTMKITGAPDREGFMDLAHGLSTWTDDGGETYVYVVTHPQSRDTVEVFKLKDDNTLKYKRTITDPMFKQMNDLVVVGKDKFFITLFWYYSGGYMQLFEMLARRPWGGVLYYDGSKARQAASDLFMPNGINVSKDKKTVFVSEFGAKTLIAYQRSTGNVLTKLWEKYSDTHLDNIEVDPDTGDLFIGCHPVAFGVYDLMLTNFGYALPSQVLRYKMKDNFISEIEEIYADDGSELYGSSVGTYAMGKLVIGTVTRQTLVCDVNYLSP